jgi:hypothetical protein
LILKVLPEFSDCLERSGRRHLKRTKSLLVRPISSFKSWANLAFFVVLAIFCLGFPQAWSAPAVSICKKKILIVPAPINDPKFNSWLIQQAKTAFLKSHNLKCNPFYNVNVSAEQYDFLGLHARNPKVAKSRQLEIIKERTNLDQMLFLNYKKRKENAKLEIELFDVVADEDNDLTLERVDGLLITLKPETVAKKRSSFLRQAFLYLMPNAFSLGGTTTTASMDLAEGYVEESSVNRSTLPTFLSSIQLGQITHPDSYGLFDFSYSLYPGVFFVALDQYTTIRKTAEPGLGEEQSLHVQAFGANLNLNAEATFHSPIGATYISLGIGPTYFAHRQENEDEGAIFSPFDTRLRLGHRAFVTKNLFLSFDFDQVIMRDNIYDRENLAKSNSLVRASASIGWYFPISSLYY